MEQWNPSRVTSDVSRLRIDLYQRNGILFPASKWSPTADLPAAVVAEAPRKDVTDVETVETYTLIFGVQYNSILTGLPFWQKRN